MSTSNMTGHMERRRVREHLSGAEAMARGRRVRLEPLRALTRSLLLEELAAYRRQGRFPLNHDRRSPPRPQFIDPHGTRCAVAHMMDVSGQRELVRRVAETNNHARVRELARLPEVRAWLAASGISLEEAARIQPAYCQITQAEECFCQSSGLEQLGLGTVVVSGEPTLEIRVDRLAGEFPGVELGERHTIESYGSRNPVGDQVLFSLTRDDSLGRVAPRLVIRDDFVRCDFPGDTKWRRVGLDTTFELLLAEPSVCASRLETLNER